MDDTWIKFPTEPGIYALSRYNRVEKEWGEPEIIKVLHIREQLALCEEFGNDQQAELHPLETLRYKKIGSIKPPAESLPVLRWYRVLFNRTTTQRGTLDVVARDMTAAEVAAWKQVGNISWERNVTRAEPFVESVEERSE